ncbi:MAG: PD-(D/E)XK nuclease family protein [bacterium]
MENTKPHSRIIIARGALAAEAILLREVHNWVRTSTAQPQLLGRTLGILVPSRSLREHISALLVRRIRPALAGLSVRTLHGFAVEILERTGEKSPVASFLVELLIRRHACWEPFLREELQHLKDGMGSVVGTVLDFLEAGLEEAHVEALEELLGSRGKSREIHRAIAVLRVAARSLADMNRFSVGILSSCLSRAKEALEQGVAFPKEQGPIIVHGFAETTGLATDFLETLIKTYQCIVILDHPPRPGHWSQKDPSSAFTHRLMSRLLPKAIVREDPELSPEPQSIEIFHAAGAQAECREVALRIQALIRKRVRPEDIAVVARRLDPYILALRTQFRRLGIPFSGISAQGPMHRAGRFLQGLLELLRRDKGCPMELWLELLDQGLIQASPPGKQELILALRCLGAARITQVAALKLDMLSERWPKGYPLPMRLGLTEEELDGQIVAPRPRVPLEALNGIQKLAHSIQNAISSWQNVQMEISAHLSRLEELVSKELGWAQSHPAMLTLGAIFQELEHEIPPGVPLSYEEFLLILDGLFKQHGRLPLGGNGAGVQVLEVMEARARTFQHLFLMGMNRDFFPRPIREDPLLPDSVRQLILPLLPDIPIKSTGFQEERYLFCQLLSSAPHLVISWQSTDEDGKPMAASPLVDGLILSTEVQPARASTASKPPAPCLRPAMEHAMELGLEGRRVALGAALRVCMEDLGKRYAIAWQAPEVAQVRLAILKEMDPDLRTQEGRMVASSAGPYMGFIGPIDLAEDPRKPDPYVTTLETMASCPWQSFLKHILRLEVPQDPLEALPQITLLEIGSLVHSVLEKIASRHLGEAAPRTLEQACMARPIAIAWPEEAELKRIVRQEAQRLLWEQGMDLLWLHQVLCTRAMPYILVAKEVDWSPDGSLPQVLGVELEGKLKVKAAGMEVAVRFRADRVDLESDGLLLTDYKVGRSISREVVKEKTKADHFLRAVARGERLQAVTYAMAATGKGSVVGRYLFLKPDLEPGQRVFRVQGHQVEFQEALQGVLDSLMRGWMDGVFFPRLVDPEGKEEPDRCRYCEVSSACLRGDSGARARLLKMAQAISSVAPDSGSWESSFLRLWQLPAAGKKKKQEEEAVDS